MPVSNAEIADQLDELAELLELQEENPFRIRAYRNAASTVRSLSESVVEMLAQHRDLSELRGIGADLAGKIETVARTGRLPLLEHYRRKVPGPLLQLIRIEGLGPKRAKLLHRKLHLRSLEDLRRAALSGRIREIPGFGARTEQLIAERTSRALSAGTARRTKLSDAEQIVEPLVAHLRKVRGVNAVTVAGSYRRRRDTVGDLDLLVVATPGSRVMDRFTGYEDVIEVVGSGRTRATVRLRNGLQVDMRVVPAASHGAALHYFTGSKAHNIAVRRLAMARGLKLNEYGMFRGETRAGGRTENDVFAAIGLPFIPPELREDRGEIEAARRGRLPELVALGDLRGDLHCHSRASDGRNTIEELADAAIRRGYDYLAICDHSKHVAIAHGLDRKRLVAQIERIDRINQRLKGFVVLKSCEVDILEDGSLDLPDDVLGRLDLTVCAVHYGFHLSRRKQTDRVLRAMDHRSFNILAHPTGRLINTREPYEIDLEKVLRGAKERGCVLEVNAHPDRLDLSDEGCRMARDLGVKVAISTDAHSAADLALIRFGVDQARRGWLTAADVLNSRSLRELRRLLKR